MALLTPELLALNPDLLTRSLRWPAAELVFRVLRPTDGPILGRYLEGLSQATRQIWAPHGFDMATAERLCAELDYARALRFIAEERQNGQPEAAAYYILALAVRDAEVERYTRRGQHLDLDLTCLLAPCVADRYQSQGLGSLMMPPVLETARALGRRHVVLMGGTQARNVRAIGLYEKFGFRRMGDFEVRDLNNHDMMLDLD
jgi:GNAT superfamily N-acetyltransferase